MNIRTIGSLSISIFFLSLFLACDVQPYAQGERLYNAYCENCHARDGSGLKKLIPPIANSDYLAENIENLSCIIKFGIEKNVVVNGVEFTTPMKGNPKLTDAEIANIINFIIHDFGYESQYYSEDQVQLQLKQCL